MLLVVGLGNPDGQYKMSRHNVGFMAVDSFAHRFSFSPFSAKHQGLIAEGKIAGEKILLLKPQTYMNSSGQSVVQVAHFYKIPPENILVIHDDLDLNFAQIKMKSGGGAGGHNGLKSIDACLGSKDYYRLRIGIGRPVQKTQVVDYVLGNFSKSEQTELETLFEKIEKSMPAFIEKGQDGFLNTFKGD